MSLVSLITQDQPKRTYLRDKDNSKELLILDVTLKITPNYSADVTLFPVEDGPDITDHVRPKPVTLNIEGVISETPINLQAQLAGLAASAGNLSGGLVGGFGPAAGALAGSKVGASLLGVEGLNNPASISRGILERIITKSEIFVLYDRYKSYENLVMTALSFPRESNTGGKLAFNFTAQQIRIVKAEEVQIAKIAKAAHSATKPKNLGTQAATETTNRDSSLLFKGFKGLGASLPQTGTP